MAADEPKGRPDGLGRVRTLSAFLPCYDEAGNIDRVTRDLVAVLEDLGLDDWEVVIVDDGSHDGTGARADALADEIDGVRVVHHAGNVGYGGALRSGFGAARLDWVFFTDGDGQFDLTELSRLTACTTDHDLVVGYRLQRRDNALRKLNMHLWSGLVNRLFLLQVRDVDCAFKLVRRQEVDAIGPLESDGAFASTELLAKLRSRGVVAHEVGVSHRPREWGSATGANLGVIVRAFRDLFRLRRRLGAPPSDTEPQS